MLLLSETVRQSLRTVYELVENAARGAPQHGGAEVEADRETVRRHGSLLATCACPTRHRKWQAGWASTVARSRPMCYGSAASAQQQQRCMWRGGTGSLATAPKRARLGSTLDRPPGCSYPPVSTCPIATALHAGSQRPRACGHSGHGMGHQGELDVPRLCCHSDIRDQWYQS